MQEYKFTYGDAVDIIEKRYIKEQEHDGGSICAITVVESQILADIYKEPMGTIMYLVEFGDGSSDEVPESALRLVTAAES